MVDGPHAEVNRPLAEPPFTRYASLAGRAVYVTGGASGIGAELVRGFHANGALVTFCDRDAAAGQALAGDLSDGGAPAHFAALDLRDIAALRDSIAETARSSGPIRVLVNNAARDDRQAIAEVSPTDFDAHLAVNLKHQFFAAQAVAPQMAAAGGGAILNMSSVNVVLGAPDLAVYTTAKAGVLGMTRALARAFGPQNIRVNAILPGWVMTARQKALWVTPEALSETLAAQCLKDTLVPRDVARLVLFLASDDARMITNQSFVVDGGRI